MNMIKLSKLRLFVRQPGQTNIERSELEEIYVNSDKIMALLPLKDDDGEIVKVAFGVEENVRELGAVQEEDFYGFYVEDSIEDILSQMGISRDD